MLFVVVAVVVVAAAAVVDSRIDGTDGRGGRVLHEDGGGKGVGEGWALANRRGGWEKVVWSCR